jgi:3-keto-L-gulonate-6-phosphate decarboxylase
MMSSYTCSAAEQTMESAEEVAQRQQNEILHELRATSAWLQDEDESVPTMMCDFALKHVG